MGRPYGVDLRERAVAAIEAGLSTEEAAKRFYVSKAAAGAWARLKRRTGGVAPLPQGKPKGSVLDPHADFIPGVLEAEPDTTLVELSERLAAERGVKAVYTAVWKFLDRRAWTHKKRPGMRASGSGPT